MYKRKICKWILLFVVSISVIFIANMLVRIDVFHVIMKWNLEISNGNLIELFFVYWLEIGIILALWDLLMHEIYIHISLILDETAEYLLQTNRVRLTIWCVRLKYGISKVMFFLRLGWWKSAFPDNDNIVWSNIIRPTIKNTFLSICVSMIKIPALVALFFTAINLEWFEISDILDALNAFCNLEFDFWGFAKNLSPLITVILVVFIWDFISFKGIIRRTVAQANRKKMEDIIQQHRILTETIGMSLYSIASNIEYVINCKELVVDLWIHSKFPDYKNEKCMLQRDLNLESFCFKDIPELKSIVDIFGNFNSNGNSGVSRTFTSYKYEFLTIMSKMSYFSLQRLNEKLFTKQGMESMIVDDRYPCVEYSKEEIDEKRSNYLEYMPRRLVESLELLYTFCRYYDEMSKLLNVRSDKVGRALRVLTGKE